MKIETKETVDIQTRHKNKLITYNLSDSLSIFQFPFLKRYMPSLSGNLDIPAYMSCSEQNLYTWVY